MTMPKLFHVVMFGVLLVAMMPVAFGVGDVPPIQPDSGGDQHVLKKGYDTGQLYFMIGGAEVNPFNFNLVVDFEEPVGFATSVDGGLGLSLARTYNSAIYQTKSWRCAFSGPDVMNPDRPMGHNFEYLSIPRQNPMGLGWEFHLGRIYKKRTIFCGQIRYGNPGDCDGPYVYVAPDGSEHELTFIEAEDSYYTTDGSMIRGILSETGWTLYLPNGRILEMAHQVIGNLFREFDTDLSCEDNLLRSSFTPGKPAPGYYEENKLAYYTTRIRGREEDAAGQPAAWIDVEYHPAPFDYIMKKIQDSHYETAGEDRTIEIAINSDDDSVPSYGHITKILFPVPPDENGIRPLKAAFDYEYVQQDLDKTSTPIHKIDLLSAVRMPKGYAFEYTYLLSKVGTTNPAGTGGESYGGQLETISYPSGKLVKLTYLRHYRKWRTWVIEGGVIPSWCVCAIRYTLDAGILGISKKEEYINGIEGDTSAGNYRAWTFGLDYEQSSQETINQIWEAFAEDHCTVQNDFTKTCTSEYTYYDSKSWMLDPENNLTEVRYDTSSHIDDGYHWWDEPQYNPKFGKAIVEEYFAGRIRPANL